MKTKKHRGSVAEFIKTIENDQRRADCNKLLKFMREVTGERPAMWGDSIVGFGEYHYTYASGREGDWMRCGFSPRKTALTIYLMGGFGTDAQMKKLGSYKTGKCCLYVKRLEDIHLPTFRKLIERSDQNLDKLYG